MRELNFCTWQYKLICANGTVFEHPGFTASTISFPLEVARKRLMVGALQGKCPPNMVAALSEVIREEGLKGLYRGWGASCLKVMPSSGITWMFYEAWKDILIVQKGISL
jgi:solute carrier family 25 phosphate transporter 23/24/25/41